MDDELSTPLGQRKIVKPPQRPSRVAPRLTAGLMSLVLAIFGGWAMLVDNPYGGEPTATALVDVKQMTASAQATREASGKSAMAAAITTAAQPALPSAPPGAKIINIIDGSSGKREQVVIPIVPAAAPEPAMPRPQRASVQKSR